MDRVRTEIVASYVIADRHREARREALLRLAARNDAGTFRLAYRLGHRLVEIGCRLEGGHGLPRGSAPRSLSLGCGCAE